MMTIGDLDKKVPPDVIIDIELSLNKFWWLIILCFLLLTVSIQISDLSSFIKQGCYITLGYQWFISIGVTVLLCIKR